MFESVNLTVGAGGAALITGPNGTGKTTLLRIVAGLLAPAAGRVTIHGARAWLEEASALDHGLSLRRSLAFWAALDGTGDRVEAALQAVGLGAIAEVPVRFLSTGQRRRAGIARVIASGADIWLLDEPANGLDSAGIGLLEEALARHRAAGGIAVIATHLPVTLPDAVVIRMAT